MAGLLLTGCGGRRVNTFIENFDADLEFNEYVESMTMTEIMTSGEIMLGDVSKAVMADDSTCIFFDSEQRGLVKMTVDGRITDNYQKTGRGPDEYIELHDFDIDADGQRIYVLCASASWRIMVLDLDFNLERIISLDKEPRGYYKIAFFEDELYLYSHAPWTVYKLDENDFPVAVIKSERSNKGIHSYLEPVFYKNGNMMLVKMCGDDVIYKIENGRSEKFFTLNWPDKEKRYRVLSELKLIDYDDQIEYAQNTPPRVCDLTVNGEKLRIIYSHFLYGMAIADIKTGEILDDGEVVNTLEFDTPILNVNGDPSAFFFAPDTMMNQRFYGIDYHPDSSKDAILVRYKLKKM